MTDYRMLCSSPGCTNIAEVIVGDETPAGSVGRQHLYCPEHEVRETTNKPRAIVRAFALAMERKLAANDATKGGWRDEHFILLLDDLEGEIAELRAALHGHVDVGRYAPPDVQAVLLEAADVALYAMMIADVCGALPPTDERGR